MKKPNFNIKPGKTIGYIFVILTVTGLLILIFGFPVKKVEKNPKGFTMIRPNIDTAIYRKNGIVSIKYMNGYDSMIDVKEVEYKIGNDTCTVKTNYLEDTPQLTYFKVIANNCPTQPKGKKLDLITKITYDRHISYSKIHRVEDGVIPIKVRD